MVEDVQSILSKTGRKSPRVVNRQRVSDAIHQLFGVVGLVQGYLSFFCCMQIRKPSKKKQLTKSLKSPKEETSVCPFFSSRFSLIQINLISSPILIPAPDDVYTLQDPYHLCVRFIWIYLVNVGKYTILMDAMGYIYRDSARFTRSLLQTPSCPVAQLFEGPDPEILSPKMMLKNNPPTKTVLQPSAYHGVTVYQNYTSGPKMIVARRVAL